MINENFIFLGTLIAAVGGISYIKDTLQGKIQPNRVSWGLWTVAVAIAFAAEVKQGVGILSIATFMVGITPLFIFLASFVNKKAYWKLTKFDLWCGVLSLLGLILWYFTKIGNLAIFFSIMADLSAGIPTLVKSFKYPETENYLEFMGSFINVGIAMLTIKTWTFAYYAFPGYIFLYDLTAFLLIRFRLGKRFIK